MNLKKFKKSLVSIVLGSSLFLGNGGVICQQPKARFTDEFFTTAREKYKHDPGILLLLCILEFFSNLAKKIETNLATIPKIRQHILLKPIPYPLYYPAYRLKYYLDTIPTDPPNAKMMTSFKEKLFSLTEHHTTLTNQRSKTTAENPEKTNDYLIPILVKMESIAACLLYEALCGGLVEGEHLEIVYSSLEIIEKVLSTNNYLKNETGMILLLEHVFTKTFPIKL